MFRNIIAWDQVIGNAMIEGNVIVYEFNKTKSKDKKLADRINEAQKAANNQKNEHYYDLVDAEIAEMKKDKVNVPLGYRQRRFVELKNEGRDIDILERAIEDAKEAALVGQPKGFVGKRYKAMSDAVNHKDGDEFMDHLWKWSMWAIFPFMKIGANAANMGIDWSIGGFIRAGKSERWTAEGGMRKQTDFEKREHFMKAALGTATFAAMFWQTFDWDDEEGMKIVPEEDRWFRIRGPMTGEWFKDKDVATDALPWSISFKNPIGDGWMPWLRYRDSPIGHSLAPIGIMHDEIVFKDFQSKVKGVDLDNEIKKVDYMLKSVFFGTYRYAMDHSYNQGMNTLGRLADPSETKDYAKEVGNLVKRPIVGTVYPNLYKQMYQKYRAFTDQPEKETSGWYATPAKIVPIVNDLLENNKVDFLGHPVIRRFDIEFVPDWFSRYFKPNLDYRETLPDWNIIHKYPEVEGGSFYPPDRHKGNTLDDDMKIEFKTIAGEMMSEKIYENMAELDNMGPFDLQVEINTLKKRARAEALQQLLVNHGLDD
jgi:hypothetical protein